MKQFIGIFGRMFKVFVTAAFLIPALAAACFVFLAFVGFSTAHADYTFITLNYPGAQETNGTQMGINNAGTIVGSSYPSGFVVSNGTYTALNYPDAIWTYAQGINNAGTIVGYEFGAHVAGIGPLGGGFSLSNGTYTDLGYAPSGGSGNIRPCGINDAGTIVGITGGPNVHFGFVLSNGTYTPVNYPGASETFVYGINDAGTIVGCYLGASGYWEAFEAIPSSQDVSSQIGWTTTGFLYSRVSKLYTGSLTITNTGSALTGTISVVLNNLTQGVSSSQCNRPV